jgi:hypothetical protein
VSARARRAAQIDPASGLIPARNVPDEAPFGIAIQVRLRTPRSIAVERCALATKSTAARWHHAQRPTRESEHVDNDGRRPEAILDIYNLFLGALLFAFAHGAAGADAWLGAAVIAAVSLAALFVYAE